MVTVRSPAGVGRPRGVLQLWKPGGIAVPGHGSRIRRAIVAGAQPRRWRKTVQDGAPNAVVAPGGDIDAERTGIFNEVREAEEGFDWAKQWHPVARLQSLEETPGEGSESGLPQIQRRTIFDRDIVLWRDAEGEWRAAEDRCAHRQAALSLETVRPDGTLACRFQGWCFNGRGECTHATQASEGAFEASSRSGSGSKITAFPTLEMHGLLWVWPDDSPSSWVDSAASVPAAHKVTDPNTEWPILDLATNSVTAVDNPMPVSDSKSTEDGHIPLGSRRLSRDTQPVTKIVQTGDTSANRVIALSDSATQGVLTSGHAVSESPCTATASAPIGGSVLNSAPYHTPSNGGRTRFVLGRSVDSGSPSRQDSGVASADDMATLRAVVEKVDATVGFLKALPLLLLPGYVRTSIEHLHREELPGLAVDQGVAAPGVVKIQGSRESVNWRRYPIVPPPSGHGVTAFRSCFSTFAGGEPTWIGQDNSQGPALTAIYSRWDSHTKSCSACRKSLKFLRGLEGWLLKAVAISLAATLLAANLRQGRVIRCCSNLPLHESIEHALAKNHPLRLLCRTASM